MRPLQLILILGFFVSKTSAANFCPPPQLATRTSNPKCVARYRLSEGRFLCVSKELWEATLHSDLTPCAQDSSQWRITFFSKNNFDDLEEKKRIYSVNANQLSPSNSHHPFTRLKRSIERVRERASLLIQPWDELGVFRHLILNEKTDPAPLNLLRRLGFVHLITATGIHLYAIHSTWSFIFSKVCKYCRIPVRRGLFGSRVFSFFLIQFLWGLSGARPGMLRPWIVILLRQSGHLLGFRWHMTSPLILALTLEVIVELIQTKNFATAWSHQGRIIYALAVGGGLLWHSSFKWKHLGLAIGSWIGVAFWEVWHTHTLSLATPVWSLITLPVFCSFGYPLITGAILANELGLSLLAQQLLALVTPLLHSTIQCCTRLSVVTGNLWTLAPLPFFFGIMGASFIFYFPTKIHKQIIALLSILCLVFRFFTSSDFRSRNSRPHSSIFEKSNYLPAPLLKANQVLQLDVGQGDSAVVTSGYNKLGMVDVGPSRALSFENWIDLFALLKDQRLTWVALTHLDEDHAGGLLKLSMLLKIGCVAAPREEWLQSRGIRLKSELISRGIEVFDFESPHCIPFPKKSITSRGRNGNMGILFIPLQSGGYYLNAGDASEKTEIQILPWLRKMKKDLKNSSSPPTPVILKTSHHGSRYSSHPALLKEVSPKEAWISVGSNNHYGHPSPITLKLLDKFNIPVRRTDVQGAIKTQ